MPPLHAHSLGVPLLALALAVAPARAQTIGGHVRDARSRRPAQQVDVHVIGSDGVVLFETATDSAGVFYAVLPAPGRVRLHFDIAGAAGFDSDTMTVGLDEFVEREFALDIPRVYLEFEVEKQVAQIPRTGVMRYPEELKARNVEGEVLAQFVVGIDGRAIMPTFRVLRADDPGFISAVRRGLETMRFHPAEINGEKVIQLVQQPFTFSLTRAPGAPATDGMPPFPDPQTRGRPTP